MSEQEPTISEILIDTQANLPKLEDYGYDPSTLLTSSLLGTTYFQTGSQSSTNSGAMPFDESVVPGGATGTEEGQGVPMTGLFTLGDATEASGAIRLVIADGKGDVYLASGKTDFVTTTAGFIIGIDDSDADKVKFYLGDTVNYLYWDGSNLTITGAVTASALDIGGADSTSWHVDSSGNMWLGDAAFASAPFKVSSAGALTTTNATITGTVNATAGTFSGTITASGTISGGTITGATITGATITGSTLQTGTAGENVNITSAYISVRNGASELGYFKATSGTYAGTELKTDAIYLGGGLSYILGNSSGMSLVTDSGTKAIYIQGQAGIFLGAASEFTVDQALSAVIVSDSATFNIPKNAGAPTGGSSGGMVLDTTNSRIYFKVGSTWKYAALT